MVEPTAPSTNWKKRALLLLKIILTVVCLWYVSTRIDLQAAGIALTKANWGWLSGAFLLYCASKIISAVRLNVNFRNINIVLDEGENLKLYWLGMFYNLFLPGSITGDAYKVILLAKRYKASYKKLTAAVLLDRFSGLAGLGIVLFAFGFFVLNELALELLLMTTAILGVVLLYIIIRKWLKDFLPGFGKTLLLGILVQGIQVLAVYVIMLSLGLKFHDPTLIFLFLLSSIASVLPLTIGGLGIREIVFLYGASHFGLQQESAVVISLIFFLITVASSAIGAFYVFRDPLDTKKTGSQ
jgi:uncharacterized membrane protein YbhN (UPF0104 family)